MPWEEVTVLHKRKEFVMLACQAGVNMSALCARFQISRKTGYKWLHRYGQAQDAGLHNRSRRAHHYPYQSPQEIEEAVLAMRDRHPAWGGRKIAHVLQRDHQRSVAPSTVTSILHRHGRISPEASAAAKAWQRFEHEAPNHLWQMDFKGHFAMGDARCHPLTVMDDHSRYNLVLAACENEQSTTVQAHLEAAFRCYGLPLRINTDNGSPWGTAGPDKLTRLGVWLIQIGIQLSHSRPHHPQTNGKEERFHRSLKAEVLAHRHFKNRQQVQAAFDDWRLIYNEQRPHEALSMHTPTQRYCPSARPFPETLPEIEYGPDDLVRKVQQQGWMSFKGRAIRTSKALVGKPIALRPRMHADGVYDLYFCHYRFDSVNLKTLNSIS